MIDVIAFLINNFQDFDTCPPSEALGSLLEQVGFQDEEIRDTLLFMNVLQERSRSLHRNFQGYTTKGGADLIGIGLTSIGEGARHYAQNFKDMDAYEAAIDAGRLPYCRGILLNEEDLLRKEVIMGLMSNFCVDIEAIEEKFKIKFFEHFGTSLKQLEALKDFVQVSPHRISVTPTGTLLIRNIAMCFDEYMVKNLGEKRFSKTV